MKPSSNQFTLYQLCGLLDIEDTSNATDHIDYSGTYSYVYDEAIKEGKTDEQACESAMKAESDELGEYWEKYECAVVKIAQDLFAKHNLTIEKQTLKKRGEVYLIKPMVSWKDSCAKLLETINGVGSLHFSSVQELLNSGPYTARAATLTHLHYIRRYPDVYGDSTVKYMLERELR